MFYVTLTEASNICGGVFYGYKKRFLAFIYCRKTVLTQIFNRFLKMLLDGVVLPHCDVNNAQETSAFQDIFYFYRKMQTGLLYLISLVTKALQMSNIVAASDIYIYKR